MKDWSSNKPAVPTGTEAVQGTVPTTTTPGTPTTATPTAPVTGEVTLSTSGTPAPAGAQPTALEQIMGSNVGASPATDSTWKEIWSFLKSNDKLVSGVIQAGSSFLSGATNPLTGSQQKALDAQAKANQAAANKYNAEAGILEMQRSNMSQPIPVASRVTGAPQGVGLINRWPQITGAPA